MHNIKELRKNLKDFKSKFLDRNFDFKIDVFDNLDKLNRNLISEKEKLEQEKKILSKTKNESNFEKSKKISKKIFTQIVKNQTSDRERKKRADYLITNNGSKKNFIKSADGIIKDILK